jgi:hypothetical protein
VLREEGALVGTNFVARLELAKFWAAAGVIAWLMSFLGRPWPTIGLMAATAIIVLSAVLVFGLLIELRGRAGDKFYNMFTRKHLSREYREEDR